MNRSTCGVFVALLLLAGGCASVSGFDDAREEILRIDAEWSRLASEGRDVERVVSYWSEDAVVMPPGQSPLVGRAAIREFVAGAFKTPGFSIAWKTHQVVVARSGDLAYATGTNRVTVNGPDGKQMVLDGKSVSVWRKVDGAGWKCVVDIWNDRS